MSEVVWHDLKGDKTKTKSDMVLRVESDLSLPPRVDTTDTALWVMNHAGAPEPHFDSHSPVNDDHIPSIKGTETKIPLVISKSFTDARSTDPSNPNCTKAGQEVLVRSRSADLKMSSIDDLSSLTSSQTRLKLQLKKVRVFTLRKFRSKPSMISSSDSINSEDSGSISINSSFISIPQPAFGAVVKSPVNSLTESPYSVTSPLQSFSPHPKFNTLAALLNSKERQSVAKSASDSTLLNDHSDNSSCASCLTSTEDEGMGMGSSPPARADHLAQIPSSVEQQPSSSPLTTTANHQEGKRKREVRSRQRQDALSLTHPPLTRNETKVAQSAATDSNDFQRLHVHKAEVEPSRVLSDDSLFASNDDLSKDSPLLAEIIGELPPKKSQPGIPKSNRGHKSEPFPEGYIDPCQHAAMLADQGAAAISQSVGALQSVEEEAPAASTQKAEESVSPRNRLKDADNRRQIAEEIIQSESRYVENLEQISQAVKKIREDAVLDEEIMNTIFHNLRLRELAIHHRILLDSLKSIVTNKKWDSELSTIGAVTYSTFQSPTLHDNYLAYVKNCDCSKELIKHQLSKNAAFEKFNVKYKLQNRSGFDLKDAVTLPANRLISYKTLLERYNKYTPSDHPDYEQVPKAIAIVKSLLDDVGKFDPKSRQRTLRDLEDLLDVSELVAPDREFLRVDTVNIFGRPQEYRLWMFSDLMLITINKLPRQSSSRKESKVVHGQHGQDIVPGHRRFYKLHKRVGLDNAEVLNSPQAEVKKYADDMRTIESDLMILRDIQKQTAVLSRSHEALSSQVNDTIHKCEQNLYALKKRTADTDLTALRLQVDGGQEYKMIFKDQKARSSWEADLLTAKQNLEAALVNKLPPEFIDRIPVDKTRAGMQFTCATSAVVSAADREVLFCNSDSGAGHLCRLSVSSRPSLIDCVPVPGCNSRISCICSTPPHTETDLRIYDSPTLDTRQPLIWLGCDDGMLHLLSTNLSSKPLKERHQVINCVHPVLSMVYNDGKLFVALNKRKIQVFHRSHDGVWNTDSTHTFHLNTQGAINQLIQVSYKLWCSSGNEITIIDPLLEQPERSFKVSRDKNICVQSMAYSRQGIVAVALKSSCDIKLFHYSTLKHLADINVFSAVAQKLSKCDEIIKQHKTACLKITSLVCCKHILWIGTTAGVVLTLRLPQVLSTSASQQELDASLLTIEALDIGHTGNVRFLAFAELLINNSKESRRHSVARHSLVSKMLVISGGDGFEVIDPSQEMKEKETVGFNDCINHLLVWQM